MADEPTPVTDGAYRVYQAMMDAGWEIVTDWGWYPGEQTNAEADEVAQLVRETLQLDMVLKVLNRAYNNCDSTELHLELEKAIEALDLQAQGK